MRIGLITVLTDNIENMKIFYSQVLGFEIIEEMKNYIEFRNEGVRFAVTTREEMFRETGHKSYLKPREGQSFELAFPVGSPEDVDKVYNELLAKGATQIKEPMMMPWGRKTGFIADPEGNIHELYSYKVQKTDD